MCREEHGDDRVMADLCKGEVGANADTWEDGHCRATTVMMADLCQGEVGANADTWEDGHCRATTVMAARMRVACTRTFCSTLCAEIRFRLLTLQIRARGYLSALSTIVIIACVVAAAALVRFALTAKCSLIAHCSHCSSRRSTRFRVIGSGRSINQPSSRANCSITRLGIPM